MRRLLVVMLAVRLCMQAPGASAQPVDCGATPTVTCLADTIFALAKALPDGSDFRRHLEFAEQELLPGSSRTAVEYVVWDNPDPAPWEDIEWIAKAGRFDHAIELAKQRSSPVERLGGLLVVATTLLDRDDKVRAARIVADVERELPSIVADKDDEYASSLRRSAGEIRARLGHTEVAARLIGSADTDAVGTLLSLASRYPAAAGLREQAWQAAERLNKPYGWQLVVEDAVARADQGDIARIGPRAISRLDGMVDSENADALTTLARALLTAGLPDLAARLVKPWAQWVDGKDATRQHNTLVQVIPVLVGLAQDDEVEAATHLAGSGFDRSRRLSLAAEEYFRIGRSDRATRYDREALSSAVLLPTGVPKLQWEHDAALHNLALVRAGRGDIQGALDAAAKLGDEVKISEAAAAIVRRAIDEGQGPVAGPAIEALQQHARAAGDIGYLLQAAKAWYDVGSEEEARRGLDEAMKTAAEPQASAAAMDLGLAAELTWRINGRGEAKAMLAIVDRLTVQDPGAIDHLIEIMKPISPAVAVQLAGRQTEPEREIDELANIAIQIAGDGK